MKKLLAAALVAISSTAAVADNGYVGLPLSDMWISFLPHQCWAGTYKGKPSLLVYPYPRTTGQFLWTSDQAQTEILMLSCVNGLDFLVRSPDGRKFFILTDTQPN